MMKYNLILETEKNETDKPLNVRFLKRKKEILAEEKTETGYLAAGILIKNEEILFVEKTVKIIKSINLFYNHRKIKKGEILKVITWDERNYVCYQEKNTNFIPIESCEVINYEA